MVEQTALFPVASTAQSVAELFSKPAWRALTREGPSMQAVHEIRATPAIHAECAQHLADLERACRPAGHEVVEAAIRYLVATYGTPWETEEDIMLAKAAMHESLDDLPREAIRLGVRDYNRLPDARYFPRPGPLRALCELHSGALTNALFRAKHSTTVGDTERGPIRVEQTEEQREWMAKQLKELAAALGGKRSGLAVRETDAERASRLAALRRAAADAGAPPEIV